MNRKCKKRRCSKIPYIEFTEAQKQCASEVDLEEFLLRQGEKLIPSGPEKRLASDHSITVRGNYWYDHAEGKGGGPISFLQKFYGLTYPESMRQLLNGKGGKPYEPIRKHSQKEKKPFVLPLVSPNMRRVYAYLLQNRGISREVLDAFAHAKLIYESAEPSADRTKEYHNAVFVGCDECGVARHAHKRGLYTFGEGFKRNAAGCDSRYSFHYCGTDNQLYAFEAPIDMLSFITLYPDNWRRHSYVALCGTSPNAVMWMLEQNPDLRQVILCLDNDEAGIKASHRLLDTLQESGYDQIGILLPSHKDWNEELTIPPIAETQGLAMNM